MFCFIIIIIIIIIILTEVVCQTPNFKLLKLDF